MLEPTFKNLKRPIFEDGEANPVFSISFAENLHPDPRFYKYRWWVFWEKSPCEGSAFLQLEYALSTAQAQNLIEQLTEQRKRHFIYNAQYPRHEVGITPFDPHHSRWEGVHFEVPLSQDTDNEWQGHR